ncbi:MAG: hypothetical protein ABJD07_15675 [Gemmatimonadaceae bacterium]
MAHEDEERKQVAREIADRLRRRGVSVEENEPGDELVELLEAVEAFEREVERAGGDLMVDEAPSREPDDARFALPRRNATESVRAYITRIERSTDRIANS